MMIHQAMYQAMYQAIYDINISNTTTLNTIHVLQTVNGETILQSSTKHPHIDNKAIGLRTSARFGVIHIHFTVTGVG